MRLRGAVASLAALLALVACEPLEANLLRRRAGGDGGVDPPVVDPCPSPTVAVRSLATIASAYPRITAAGTRLVVAYSEDRSGTFQAVAVPVDPATLAAAPSFQLSQSGGSVPAVTWDGQRLVAVWLQIATQFGEGPILLGRFGDTGAREGALLELTPVGRLPDVTWNGATHAVTWQDSTLVWQGFAGLVNGDGTLLRAGQNVCNWGDCLSTPHAAWNGELWGVSWLNDGLGQSGGGYDLGFRLLSATGDLLTEPVAVSTTGGVYSFAIGSDGDGFLLAYVQSVGASQVQLVLAHVDRTAAIIDSAPLATVPASVQSTFGPPDLLWDNGRYVMAWVDGAAGATTLSLSWLTAWGNEFGRVAVTPVPVAQPGSSGGPAIARLGSDYFLTWWQSEGGVKEIKVARVSCAN